jgi:asparagine synthetase B (glutamine-hydrolysing)
LIRANKHRGGDGSGIWSEKWGLIKGVTLNVVKEFMRRSDESTFLIHLRSASSGDVNNGHCHPFIHSNDVVFCHNGHISNYLDYKVSMDSLAGLYAVIRGIKEINKLSGWFVFAWLDKRDGTFNLLNHNGSIQYGWLGGRLVFASMGLDRYLKHVFEVPQNVWYTFNLSGQNIIRLDSVRSINPVERLYRYYSPYDGEYYPAVTKHIAKTTGKQLCLANNPRIYDWEKWQTEEELEELRLAGLA